MNYDPVPICLYYGGTITQDSNGYCYDGQISHIIHANPKIRFHELERKIYSLTKWSEDTYDLEINSRWQVGRGGRLFFILVPITDDESLRSVIRNTQSGKLDWSIVELYIEKKSKEAGCSGTAEEREDVETQIPEFEIPSNSTCHEEIGNVEIHVNTPAEREDVMIGEVGRIVMDELNTFDEARVNNNLVNHDDGDEAFPTIDDDDQEEEEVEVMRDLEGIEHFRRSAPEYFFDMDMARCDIRGGIHGKSRNIDEFYVGQEFEDRDHLKATVKQWSVMHHREFITHKSTPSVYTLKCKQADRCPWRLHASLSKKSGTFKVKTFVGPHTCVNEHLTRDHRQLSSQFISRYILGVIRRQLGTTPAAIVEIINEKFGYNISYAKAWRGKNKALKHLFGGWKEAYSLLPRLLAAIKMTNPGTVSKEWSDAINLDGTRTLRGFFWAFGPAIEAFRHCRPLLSIDGTFLYGKYKGVLLVAMAVDANGQLLPLAYALVEKESIDSWNWFMRCIRELVTQREGICVISDRHAGIMNVFNNPNSNWRPPMAYHRYCMRQG